jgi:hypothetical protein
MQLGTKMKNPKLKPELLTEDQRARLEAYEAQQKQLTILQDIADMTQDMVMEGDKEKKFTQKAVDDMGALLVDMRESLKSLESKEDPESPDIAKPIVEAVAKLEKALNKIEVKPSVTVSAPDVNVPKVDLTEFNKLLRTEIPSAFEKAIKSIPKVEVSPPDNSELLEAWEGISEQLLSIEAATRMKPVMPTAMKVTNPDGTAIGNFTAVAYKTKIDKSSTTNVIYIGEAAIGTATSSAAWKLTKIDKTVTDNVTITYANSGAFTAVYDDRVIEVYS